MNPSTLLLSLLFTLSLIFISQAALPPPGSPKLYQIVCKEARNDNNRCLTLLETNIPQIALANDYVSLCRLILEMAIDKSTKAQNYVKSLMPNYPSSEAIKECATNDYDELVGSFKSSLGEIVVDPLTANYDAKVAGDGPDTCARALANEKIVNPSLNSLNNDMYFLSTVAFLATNHLSHQ